MKFKIVLAIIHLIASLTPFITSIVLREDDEILHFGFINISASIVILLTLVILFIVVKEVQVWNIILTNNLLGLVFFVAFFMSSAFVLQFWDFQKRKDDYSKMHSITENEKVRSLHLSRDRSLLKVNEVRIFDKDSIEIISGIDLKTFNILDSLMFKNEVSGITKKEDKIYFTSGGFIDSESGYAYTEKDEKPVKNHAGSVLTWQKVDNNWYYWYAD